MLAKVRSDFSWDCYLSNRKAKTRITAFKYFVRDAQSPNIQPKGEELDNELIIQRPKPDVKDHLENNKLMRVESSASYTRVQNGAAERSGGVLKDEIRTIKIGANFSNEPLVRVRQFTFIIERPIQVEVVRSLSHAFNHLQRLDPNA